MLTESAEHTYGPEEAIAVGFASSMDSLKDLLETRPDLRESFATAIGFASDATTLDTLIKLLQKARITAGRIEKPKKKRKSKALKMPAVRPDDVGVDDVEENEPQRLNVVDIPASSWRLLPKADSQ